MNRIGRLYLLSFGLFMSLAAFLKNGDWKDVFSMLGLVSGGFMLGKLMRGRKLPGIKKGR